MRNKGRRVTPPAQPATPPLPPPVDVNEVVSTMTITLHRNGRLNVNGPIGDKIRSYGMLHTAMDVVRDFKAPEEK